MSTTRKYEIIEKGAAGMVRAKHARLDREVELHRFPIDDLDDEARANLLNIATHLGAIDHPDIPHLLDCDQNEGAYLLVLESHPGQPLAECLTAESDVDVVCVASRAERIAQALSHAHQKGVAHGDLALEDILIDLHGQPKVLGVGMRQLHAAVGLAELDVQELIDRDLRSLGEILLASLRPSTKQTGSRSESDSPVTNDPASLSELREFARQLTGQSGSRAISSLESAHQWLNQWLALASAAREARRFSVEPAAADREAAPKERSRRPLQAACVVIGCSLPLAAAIAFWPPPEKKARLNPRLSVTGADTPKGAEPEVEPPRRRPAEPPASSLSKVGVLNNPGPAATNHDYDTQDRAHHGSPQPSNHDELAADTPQAGPLSIQEGESLEPSNGAQTSAPPSPTPSDPFGELPRAISLPDASVATASTLLQFDVSDDAPLELHLLGGEGAARHVDMALVSAAEDSWRITSRDKGSGTDVARLARKEGGLMFQWLDARASAAPDSLRNTGLHLSTDGFDAVVALREPQVLDPVRVTLRRRMQLAIDIQPLPKLDDVFLEFVWTEGSRMVAIDQGTVSAVDGELQLGLDAGKDSLILVRVISLMKKGRGLLLIPLSRSTPSAMPVEIQGTTPHAWQRELVALRLQTLAWKQAYRKSKGQPKRILKARLARREAEIELRQKRMDAYTAALDASLRFRIVRKTGDYEMDLVHIGDVGERGDAAR